MEKAFLLLHSLKSYGIGISGLTAGLSACQNDIVALLQSQHIPCMPQSMIKHNIDGIEFLTENRRHTPA